jgi:hypothetical protein
MSRLEKVILEWLESRSDDWFWFFGGVKYDKKATIEKFRRDRRFRKFIVEQVEKAAIEMFEQHLKREKSNAGGYFDRP